jgi:Thymidylate synthase complementing protein
LPMKVVLVWSSPSPELTIAVAMRRCYSTKPIEEIETELKQKGPEYWKYLLTKAMQDKSLDVLEHFTMTFLIEGVRDAEASRLLLSHSYLRALRLNGDDWLMSLNARSLVELWHGASTKGFAEAIVSELDSKDVSPLFNGVAFGERVHAS